VRRRHGSDGYALLAAVLIMVLAATFALVLLGAVRSRQAVERSDAAAWRAEAAVTRAVSAVTAGLRWRPGAQSGAMESEGVHERESWRAAWAPAPPVAGAVWPRLRVRVEAASGEARRDDELTMELQAEPWATGVTCRGDAEIDAPLEVCGSGVYVGGCLRGRENVAFAAASGPAAPGGGAADIVRGEVFPDAAVHGGAAIFAGGVEIHEHSEPGIYARDTDRHAGQAVPEEWLAEPPAEFIAAASTAAAPPGDALQGARLSLAEIQLPAGADLTGGSCVLVPPMDEVTVEGSPPPEAGPLLVVVRGDAVVGQPGETVTLSGGLVVCGRLLVRGALRLEGSLHAGSLTIVGPTHISVSPGWRQRPLSGAAAPTVLEHGG
jgi:hypothetical protein